MNNEHKDFLESDWKLFRKKVIIWQENYMDQLNKEYMSILMQVKDPSTNFWQLIKRIDKDRNKPGVILDMRRSTMIENILMLLLDKVIVMEDLDEFSDVLKGTMETFCKKSSFIRGIK